MPSDGFFESSAAAGHIVATSERGEKRLQRLQRGTVIERLQDSAAQRSLSRLNALSRVAVHEGDATSAEGGPSHVGGLAQHLTHLNRPGVSIGRDVAEQC